ncbi:hypothetical protein [Anaerolentibacter hominis]|uniref:hypothetical protein n=1 Tax=Anaerolentibacter hominis TaxID=3079009 RepID=UPI0031B82237
MNGEELFEKMDCVEEAFVSEAENAGKGRVFRPWIKWGAAAACICLIAAGALLLKQPAGRAPDQGPGSAALDHDSNEQADNSDNDGAVTVPALELPEKVEEGVCMDMIGLVVYQGRIYTQGSQYIGEDAAKVKELVGDYLGYAKGNISEWSKQDDYAKEFASTVSGEIYSVKGYDSSFRLCMQGVYTENDGTEVDYVEFYENLNGISITTGEDIFGSRLNMKENWESAKFQEHENWDNGWPDYIYQELPGITQDDLNAFLDELYAGKFVNMWRSDQYSDPNAKEDTNQRDIYSEPSGHLFFYMKDGTKVELRLFEGGYVGYQHLGWYFVEMPGQIFEKIFAACK